MLAIAGCSSTAAPEHRWVTVFDHLPSALVSVSGTSDHDVWAVGGDPADGKGPLILHYDGSTWTRELSGASGDLWWVHAFDDGAVLMCGTKGLVLKYTSGAFETSSTSISQTLFGVWGPASNDVWAVGGNGANGGVILRSNGSAWSNTPLPASAGDLSLFKVWGSSANDIWIVGSTGTGGGLIHYDGTSLTSSPSPVSAPLFTVHANGHHFAAVGGSGRAAILETSSSGWHDTTPTDLPTGRLTGVFVTQDGAYASGDSGAILRESAAHWTTVDTGLDVYQTLHSIWVDPSGGVWSAGGLVDALPLSDGILLHLGNPVPGGSYK